MNKPLQPETKPVLFYTLNVGELFAYAGHECRKTGKETFSFLRDLKTGKAVTNPEYKDTSMVEIGGCPVRRFVPAKPTKYEQYKQAARKLEQLVDALTSEAHPVNTIGNLPGLAQGDRLHINKESGQTVVTIWRNGLPS